MSEPDLYTNAWYRKQFLGVNQGLNRCLADYVDSRKEGKALREQLATVVAAIREAREEIGRQADEISELKEAMEKARLVFQELRRSQAEGTK